MMARPYHVVVVLLLLESSARFGEGASNPGVVARITRKGLEYANQYAVATLRKELPAIRLPDFSGSFKIGWFGRVSYNFHSLKIHRFEVRNSDLSLLPGLGIRASLSNNDLSMGGNWKVKKGFINLKGSFDLKVDGISISVSLNLGKDETGRPTASVHHCSNSIGRVSVRISGSLRWILNLFHKRIESSIKRILENQICQVVKKSSDSHLKPYLQTLPVTLMIDQVAGIDYRLFGAPQVTSKSVDIPIKGEFFSQSQRTPVPFDAPAMMLPQQYDRMVYFAVSEYVFNTATRVYHQAGLLNVTISNGHLAGLFPNMQVQLEASPESEPHLWFTPGNVTIAPVMDVQAFSILPNSSDRRPLFQLRVKTNFSISISVNSDRIVGSVSPESELKLELKHSNIGSVDVEEMETIFNLFAREVIYPSINAQLKKGFPLPVPKNIFLNSVELQIHENFLLLGANIN
ncbi:lipopolysaccharide-binding protein-like [Ictidomys tridecemlineatus]|uniref:lipopolysaccharide-binding protein-like n=1 Tax=Ictidomys tridecemlineatus TaxID=43179 RepID=UPI000680E88E|nr:lipopolysaccharide-binding protein-like [Ictidomys tridecemlineatus]KAG3263254.1 lipopolysaccharide-binding protein-like [Ictidomys tridecemlineatus]